MKSVSCKLIRCKIPCGSLLNHICNIFTLHYFLISSNMLLAFVWISWSFIVVAIFVTQCINIRTRRKKKNNASLLVEKAEENRIIQTESKYNLKTLTIKILMYTLNQKPLTKIMSCNSSNKWPNKHPQFFV